MTAEVVGVAMAFALFAAAVGVMVTVALRWSSSRHQSRLSRLTSVEFVELFLFVEPKQFLRLNLLAVIVLPVIA